MAEEKSKADSDESRAGGASVAGWTRTDVLELVDGALREAGKEPEAMSVSFDIFNSSWSQYIESLKRSSARGGAEATLGSIVRELEGRRFWAVYCARLEEVLGGDCWVFIDRSTREVITTILGQ